MKKIVLFMLMILLILCSGCISLDSAISQPTNPVAAITQISNDAIDAMNANNNQKLTQKINELIAITQDSTYTKEEKLAAQYSAIYLNACNQLTYIVKNDREWYSQRDFANFEIFHTDIMDKVMNGKIHIDDMNTYIRDLTATTKPIYERYMAITNQ